MGMNEHITRMKQEHKELVIKTEALNSFIYGNEIFKMLDYIEQSRMIKQTDFMKANIQVLESRIWAEHLKDNKIQPPSLQH